MSVMRFGSVCSGIEAASAAWSPLGWQCEFVSEIDRSANAVLAHRWPTATNLGDMNDHAQWQHGPIDVLIGGTPCQSFSVAGLRKGMDDPRGNLALVFLGVLDRTRPAWMVWENVPGVLSSNKGRDFGAFLGGLGQLGYGFAYRVLDAQFFGVPQRRRRVFVVAHLGDWRRAAAVLFEPESLRGDSPPSRTARKDVAPTISARTRSGGGLGTDFDCDGGLIALTLLGKGNSSHDATLENYVTHTLRGDGFDASEDGTGRGTPLIPVSIGLGSDPIHTEELAQPITNRNGDPGVVAFTCKDHGADAGDLSPTLRAMGHDGSHANAGGQVAVAFNITPSNSNKDYNARQSQRAQAVTTGGNRPSARGGDLVVNTSVRRLTPRECERLQGFPDDYTLVPLPLKGRQTRVRYSSDGARYKALGNSIAVPVLRWIGERIAMVDALPKSNAPLFAQAAE